MNPLNRYYLNELSNEELAQVVRERYAKIAALDAAAPLRQELRAAGVLESTIDSLYPFNFTDFTPGLAALLTSEGLSEFKGSSVLNAVVDETNRISAKLSAEQVAYFDPVDPPDELTAAIAELNRHVETQLPGILTVSEGKGAVESVARTLVVILWYAIGQLVVSEQESFESKEISHRRIHMHFCTVTDLILPQFRLQEQVAEAFASAHLVGWN